MLTAEELLQEAQSAPKYEGVNWVQYKPVYFELVDNKGYTQKAAVDWMGNLLGLSVADRKKLRSTASHWKREKKGN